jgi:hypothetical protein
MFPRRLALPVLVAVAAPLALPAASPAATGPYPTIRSVAPKQLAVGQTLTLKGSHYRKGKKKNTVVFKRDGGRAIFVRAPQATSTRITLVVPAKLLPYFRQKAGKPQPTRFRLRVLAARFGKRFTPDKLTPLINPTGPVKGGTADDCDGDTIPNSTDNDDDNDLLSDGVEQAIGTKPCNPDTDGDGMTDGWEYYSALDRNSTARPSPNARPYPNALDGKDGALDQDGDALTNAEEYAAWATYGGNRLPLSYSGGTPTSVGRTPISAGQEYMDRDGNGYLSDNERDADGDGISNQDEGVLTRPVIENSVGFFDPAYLAIPAVAAAINTVPLYGPLPYTQKADPLDWLNADTDGDGVKDGADDQDHDDIANLDELKDELASDKKSQRPLNACSPNLDSRGCIIARLDSDHDGIPGAQDPDDDNDGLPDTLEMSLGLRPDEPDTDGDGVDDGFEYQSAKDLNSSANPYPGKRPYPNALDGSDAHSDFDGDGLDLRAEYEAWVYMGKPIPYTYSDGTKWSRGHAPDPAWRDDNRDVDQDGLANFAETDSTLVGAMNQNWWVGAYQDETEYYGPAFLDTSMTDPDTDGDGIKDGADDQDHDAFPNWFEVQRPLDWACTYVSTIHPYNSDSACGAGVTHNNPLARVNPFNPCKPIHSLACHSVYPFEYYPATEDWDTPVVPGDPGTDPPPNVPPTLNQ